MIFDKFIALTKQLYPTGRAWRLNIGGVFENLHKGLAVSEAQVYEDAVSILNSTIPDNDEFSEDDATDWERRLGLITNIEVSLEDRKSAIIRKLNFPGNTPSRQHYLWLQRQLRLAGFDVWVHENLEGISPEEILFYLAEVAEHGEFEHGEFEHGVAFDSSLFSIYTTSAPQHGEFEHGEFEHAPDFNFLEYKNKVVNYIETEKDAAFIVSKGYRGSFFIGGETLGDFANVDANRINEFRQLILKTKPAQKVGYLFINYI